MSETRKVLLEGLLVLVIGGALALLANSVSRQGLLLTADPYFLSKSGSSAYPVTTNTPVNLGVTTNSTVTNAGTGLGHITARLKEHGLQTADSNQVAELFRDPRRDQELVVFIDARNEEDYQAGHIPGAYLFNHLRAVNYLAVVLPVCQIAQQIVVYCRGGSCTDSEFAALTLRRDAGVPNEKLFVYPGGIAEWTTNGLPVEVGARRSGVLKKP